MTATATAAPTVADTSVTEVTPTPSKTARAKFCFQMGELGESGCRRLPRHKGDHRATTHRAPAVKAAPSKKVNKRRKVSRSGAAGKALRAELAALVESGDLTPSEALAKFASRIA